MKKSLNHNDSHLKHPSAARTGLKKSQGFSLVEIMVVTGIMGIIILVFISMQESSLKSNNYLEFQLKRVQLQNVLIGQILNDPNNCACLFAGSSPFSSIPAAPGITLSVTPTQIGKYNFISPGICATATMPQPLVNNTGIDGLKTTSIQLTKIMNTSGDYSGELAINLQSTKPVLGSQDLPIRIPVYVSTTPATGTSVSFVSCSLIKPNQPQALLDCYETAWGPISSCLSPGRPQNIPSCNAGYTFTGFGDYSQSDNGCGSSAQTRTRVKSRCCRLLDPGGLPSANTLLCTPTALGSMTTSCDMLPSPTIPSCPAGSTFMGLANYQQTDQGCGESERTNAAAAAMCCSISGGTYSLSCRSTGISAGGPGNLCATFPTSTTDSCNTNEAFTGLSAFAQTDHSCGESYFSTNYVGSRCCSIQ